MAQLWRSLSCHILTSSQTGAQLEKRSLQEDVGGILVPQDEEICRSNKTKKLSRDQCLQSDESD